VSAYPEHEKLTAIKANSQLLGEFLDWLHNSEGVWFFRQVPTSDTVRQSGYGFDGTSVPTWLQDRRTVEELLAAFYEIDLLKLEEEKRVMLEKIRLKAH